ncbi:MAG TPA: hypothetical protein VHA77_13585, partial [Xanthobacteraceae bacterium]|nr:hypothetical protein [Xanthobacteraceae bacterium]
AESSRIRFLNTPSPTFPGKEGGSAPRFRAASQQINFPTSRLSKQINFQQSISKQSTSKQVDFQTPQA